MHQIENLIADKGSKYSVSGGFVENKAEINIFLDQLKKKKKYAKASHHSWAVTFTDGQQLKNDDGENGAGNIILNYINNIDFYNHIIVVTRWYGGVRLGAERFRHIRNCTKAYMDEINQSR